MNGQRKTGRFEDGSDEVIAACIEVHRHLGPGLLESAYELCLAHELSLRRLASSVVNFNATTLKLGLRQPTLNPDLLFLSSC